MVDDADKEEKKGDIRDVTMMQKLPITTKGTRRNKPNLSLHDHRQ